MLNKYGGENYGHLARMFVDRLFRELDTDKAALETKVSGYVEQFVEKARETFKEALENQELNTRKITKYAMIHTALMMARSWGILPKEQWGYFGVTLLKAMQINCIDQSNPRQNQAEVEGALNSFRELARENQNHLINLAETKLKKIKDKKFNDSIFMGQLSDGQWFLAFRNQQYLADRMPGFKEKLSILRDAGKIKTTTKNGKPDGFQYKQPLRIKPGQDKAMAESCYMIRYDKRPI